MNQNKSQNKKLLIITHSPSHNTKAMSDALLTGAQHNDIINVTCELKSPFDCNAEDVLKSNALILFTTENFGYMSGALKDFFERVYYPCLDDSKRNDAKPFALVVRAGLDGTSSTKAVHNIASGLKWREVQDVTLCKGDFQNDFLIRCTELGMTVAASLDNDLI